MKFFALSALAAVSLLVGCAASTEGDDDLAGSQDDLNASSKLELASSSDPASIQAQLYKLMDAFKGEKDLDISKSGVSLTIKGAQPGSPARSIKCTKSTLVSAVVGHGVTSTDSFACTLAGWKKVRNGVELPSANVPFDHERPLANNLFSLLASGEKKGGFEIERSGGEQPPCCDMPITTSMSISDSTSTLSCTNRTGGFAFMVFSECSLLNKDANDEVEVQKGTLIEAGVAIGGEGSAFNAKIGNKKLELVLSDADQKSFVVGRVARITGTPTLLQGVETHNRPAIKVTNLLVCPAPHTTFSMMPPVTDDANWLGKNCPDLDLVF